jgi:hypothetical protein
VEVLSVKGEDNRELEDRETIMQEIGIKMKKIKKVRILLI